MVLIQRLEVKKEHLELLEPDERELLLVTAHIYNELSILAKLLQFSANGFSERTHLADAEGAQVMFLLRLVIGKSHEAWRVIDKRINRNAMLRAALHDDANAGRAFTNLKKMFGESDFFS